MFGTKKRKTQKKSCEHCIHNTGRFFKQKVRHWNKCKKEPFSFRYLTEGKCCKCNAVFYKRSLTSTDQELAIEVPRDKKLEPYLNEGWF